MNVGWIALPSTVLHPSCRSRLPGTKGLAQTVNCLFWQDTVVSASSAIANQRYGFKSLKTWCWVVSMGDRDLTDTHVKRVKAIGNMQQIDR